VRGAHCAWPRRKAGSVGVALGAEAGARVLPRLAMPASPGTVLRLVRGLPLPEPEPPRAVVVDDWAMRKGRTYGTIVVDLERRRVVDLLPDRTAETLADWLRLRPGIRVVARDRSTEYARGVAQGAPGAVQVADRWHLLHNLALVLEEFLLQKGPRCARPPHRRRLPKTKATGPSDPGPSCPTAPGTTRPQDRGGREEAPRAAGAAMGGGHP
jgi:hypothetical protein